jgi:hypothetical protein
MVEQQPVAEPKSLGQRLWEKSYTLVFFAIVGATIALWLHDHMWAGRVWSAIFGGVGLVALVHGFRGLSLARESERWRPVEAEVVKAHLEEHRHTTGQGAARGTSIDYYPRITYEYEYEGEKHQCDRLIFVNVNWPGPEAQQIMDRFPVGSRHTAWVNPNDPRRAVLLKGVKGYGYRYATAFAVGTVFTVIGVVGWFLSPLLRRM